MKKPKQKKKSYLLLIADGIESSVVPVKKSPKADITAMIKKGDIGPDDGVFLLVVDIDGTPETFDFSGGFMDDAWSAAGEAREL